MLFAIPIEIEVAIIVRALSGNTTARRVEVRAPFALYSCMITIIVAGAVGSATVSNVRAIINNSFLPTAEIKG